MERRGGEADRRGTRGSAESKYTEPRTGRRNPCRRHSRKVVIPPSLRDGCPRIALCPYSPPPHSGLKTRIEVLSPSCIRTVAYEDTEHFLANPQRTLSLLIEEESACDQVSTADDA